jgi:hypothetical protein
MLSATRRASQIFLKNFIDTENHWPQYQVQRIAGTHQIALAMLSGPLQGKSNMFQEERQMPAKKKAKKKKK